MNPTYKHVVDALFQQGVYAHFYSDEQLVVSGQSKAPAWPTPGNSFSITYRHSTWYVITWSPVAYRFSVGTDLVAFCVEFLKIGDCAQATVPNDLVLKHGLTVIDHDEGAALFGWETEFPEESGS